MGMSGPNSAPEVGQQNYRTPATFLAACMRRFAIPESEGFVFDLACTVDDCVSHDKVSGFAHPELDALAEDWTFLAHIPGVCWLNPPFAQSGAFAEKCAGSGARILALVPVAIGTQWWRKHVHRKAVIVGCGRLAFDLPDGTPMKTAINRDCALLAYNILPTGPGAEHYLLENWRDW
jgi:hypothetical protein